MCMRVRSATRRTKEPHGVADAAKCMRGRSASKWPLNSHARVGGAKRETAANTVKCVCYQPATVTVTLEGRGAGEVWQNFKFGAFPHNCPTPHDNPA